MAFMAAVFKDILSAAFRGCDLNSKLNFAEQMFSFLFFCGGGVGGHVKTLNVDIEQGFIIVVRAKSKLLVSGHFKS